MSEQTALYRLYDADGILLYVGIAANPRARLQQHAATQSWWPCVQRATVSWYGDRERADMAETMAVALEQPKHNIAKQYKPAPVADFDWTAPPAAHLAPRREYSGSFGEAMRELSDAVDDFFTVTKATQDPVEGFRRASAFGELAKELEAGAARVRAGVAARIMRTRGLSVSGLAHHLGLSKARASQLVRSVSQDPAD